VPADQYGNPSTGGTYEYWDQVLLSPPAGAVYADIALLYQPTSWEYIQFLYNAGKNGSDAFLAQEGAYLLDAWLNTGMAEPYVMASATWGTPPVPAEPKVRVDSLGTYAEGKGKGATLSPTDTFKVGDTVTIIAHMVGENGVALDGVQVFVDVKDSSEVTVQSLQGFSDTEGNAVLKWKTSRREAIGAYTAQAVNAIKSGYQFEDSGTSVTFTIQ